MKRYNTGTAFTCVPHRTYYFRAESYEQERKTLVKIDWGHEYEFVMEVLIFIRVICNPVIPHPKTKVTYDPTGRQSCCRSAGP
jgi:hypothetical protein